MLHCFNFTLFLYCILSNSIPVSSGLHIATVYAFTLRGRSSPGVCDHMPDFTLSSLLLVLLSVL